MMLVMASIFAVGQENDQSSYFQNLETEQIKIYPKSTIPTVVDPIGTLITLATGEVYISDGTQWNKIPAGEADNSKNLGGVIAGNYARRDIDETFLKTITTQGYYVKNPTPGYYFEDTNYTGSFKYGRIRVDGGRLFIDRSSNNSNWTTEVLLPSNGGVILNSSGSQKFQTTSAGTTTTGTHTVTGAVNAGGFSVFSKGASSSSGPTTRYGAGAAALAAPESTGWTAIGYGTGRANTTGLYWTAIGYRAGVSNQTGSFWTALGYSAGLENTTGANWTAIGSSAGSSNETGSNWTAVGYLAGYNIKTGSNWTAIGSSAGFKSTTGANWTAIGATAGSSSITGMDWIAMGYHAGNQNETGSNWVALGNSAGGDNTTGSNWTAIGRSAGSKNKTSSNWIALGENAAQKLVDDSYATSYDNSVYVGTNTRVSANGVVNENVFGNATDGKGSNTVSIGNSDITNNYFHGNIETTGDISARNITASQTIVQSATSVWGDILRALRDGTEVSNIRYEAGSSNIIFERSEAAKFALTSVGTKTIGNHEATKVILSDGDNANYTQSITNTGGSGKGLLIKVGGLYETESRPLVVSTVTGQSLIETDGNQFRSYYRGSKKFETITDGTKTIGDHEVTGNLSANILESNQYIRAFSPNKSEGGAYIASGATGTSISQMNELGNYVRTYITLRNSEGRVELYNSDSKKFETTSTGAKTTGDLLVTGTVTAAGYLPFTGCHLATTSLDTLHKGELVRIISDSLVDMQPVWKAQYCSSTTRGIFGVVFGVQKQTPDKYKYIIAGTGDAAIKVTNENGDIQAGDYLIPSDIKGCAKKYLGEYVPLNHCGKAGENVIFGDKTIKTIAWSKE